MTLEQFVATIGVVAVVTIIVEVVKRAGNWTPDTTDRFAPLLAVVVGAIVNVLLTLSAPADLRVSGDVLVALLFGIVQGASAVGIYNLGPGQAIAAAVGPHVATPS